MCVVRQKQKVWSRARAWVGPFLGLVKWSALATGYTDMSVNGNLVVCHSADCIAWLYVSVPVSEGLTPGSKKAVTHWGL